MRKACERLPTYQSALPLGAADGSQEELFRFIVSGTGKKSNEEHILVQSGDAEARGAFVGGNRRRMASHLLWFGGITLLALGLSQRNSIAIRTFDYAKRKIQWRSEKPRVQAELRSIAISTRQSFSPTYETKKPINSSFPDDIYLLMSELTPSAFTEQAGKSSKNGAAEEAFNTMVNQGNVNETEAASNTPDKSSEKLNPLIYVNSRESAEMLHSAEGYNSHFFAYLSGHDAQINQAYCAVASSAALLNSLRMTHPDVTYFLKPNFLSADGIDLPLDEQYDPYHYATQVDLFNSCTQQKVIYNTKTSLSPTSLNREMYSAAPAPGNVEDGILTLPYGLGLKQVKELLLCHLSQDTWDVQMYTADPATTPFETMKDVILTSLSNADSRVIINYHRTWLGQVGGGHFSPIGAYDPTTDSVLILDVAKYKYPPVWAKLSQLYHSLSTIDSCGDWDFPSAQANLPEELKHRPTGTTEEWNNVQAILGCRITYRGVIVVTRKV